MPMRLFSPFAAPIAAVLLGLAACASAARQPQPGPPSPPETTAVAPNTDDPSQRDVAPPLQANPPLAGSGSDSDIVRGETGKPDGSQCLLSTECASNECEGQGCSNDKPGTCAPSKRMCTRDRRSYCGCDGKSFFASGTCPGRRYAARNACGS